jgi:NB-ARC domain
MRSGDWREQIRAAIKNGDHLLMVITRGSLASEVCGWEWYIARLEGAEISPVLGGTELRREDLPKWMRAQHVYRLEPDAPDLSKNPEWQRLLTSLRQPPCSRRMPIVTREPSDRFVSRTDEMDALREMLLDANGDAIGVTTAFAGSGGMGKTTLALALARDLQVQSAFYNGQLLIELGQNPNILLDITSAIRELTGDTSAAQSVNEAASELAKALANRSVLLIIDDVWDKAHLAHFLHNYSDPEQRQCARLVTTRNTETLPPARKGESRKFIEVDEMTSERKEATLRRGIVFVARHEHADAPHTVALLRPRHERPRRRASEPRDELPPSH